MQVIFLGSRSRNWIRIWLLIHSIHTRASRPLGLRSGTRCHRHSRGMSVEVCVPWSVSRTYAVVGLSAAQTSQVMRAAVVVVSFALSSLLVSSSINPIAVFGAELAGIKVDFASMRHCNPNQSIAARLPARDTGAAVLLSTTHGAKFIRVEADDLREWRGSS